MNDEELRDYLKRFCFGREHLICSRDLVRQKNLRESDLRKKVNRLRRKAVPIASSREGYFYASNAAELYHCPLSPDDARLIYSHVRRSLSLHQRRYPDGQHCLPRAVPHHHQHRAGRPAA